jgi:hypothetical protein
MLSTILTLSSATSQTLRNHRKTIAMDTLD